MVASGFKWLMAGLMAFVHPFYVSVTELNHNEKTKTLEISCKMFLDDTEKTLKKQLGTPVELTNPKDKKLADQLVSDYIKNHFKLKVNNKPVALEFVGYETEGASIWSYFQVNNITEVHKLEINNTILYEMYDTQISIVHATAGGVKKSTKVTNPESNLVIDF